MLKFGKEHKTFNTNSLRKSVTTIVTLIVNYSDIGYRFTIEVEDKYLAILLHIICDRRIVCYYA